MNAERATMNDKGNKDETVKGKRSKITQTQGKGYKRACLAFGIPPGCLFSRFCFNLEGGAV